jgi:23S rRNA (cytidine1920-2'-O)/16S rRNA (cytidine1409-2'-O)-methyltransferase
LDDLLVERGLFGTRDEAARWVMAGKVLVNGHLAGKPGTRVDPRSELRVRDSDRPYVSRGGHKLEGALSELGLSVEGRVALDVGASTGGFTDCLLQRGARLVYAVDVGHGQLHWRLAGDRRVVNLERTNLSDLTPAGFGPDPADRPDLATLDLSYLSLSVAVPQVARLLSSAFDLVALVKPLFELRANRVEHPEQYGMVLRSLWKSFLASGLTVCDVLPSRILGTRGTLEFFFHLAAPVASPAAPDPTATPPSLEERLSRALAGGLDLFNSSGRVLV